MVFGGGKRRDAEVRVQLPGHLLLLLLLHPSQLLSARRLLLRNQTPPCTTLIPNIPLQAVAERARQEVSFWKNQLDHAVEEKNALLDRYTALYRHAFELEQYAGDLGTENNELRHVLEQTLQDERRVQVSAAGLRSSLTGLPSPRTSAGSASPVSYGQQPAP